MKPSHSLGRISGFGQMDAIMITCAVAVAVLLVLFLLPAISHRNGHSNGMNFGSQVRGIHQSMVILAQNNNCYLPGLDATGNILASSDGAFSSAAGNTLTGASMSARYYILLNGGFIAADLLVSPQDALNKWSSSTLMPTTQQFSYAALRIGMGPATTDVGRQAGRLAEWRDNANSQAILLCDRNKASSPTSDKVRSVWSQSSGSGADWRGYGLWGDNHAEFLNATNARLGTLSISTKYGSTINSDDFLFGESTLPGKSATASAMFGYTSDNF